MGRSRRRGPRGPPSAGRGYVALQTPSSFDWRDQGILYVGKDLPDPGRARDAWVDEAGDRALRARERGRRARARAVHVARQRHALRRPAARAHRPRHPRPGRTRRRPAHRGVHRGRDVGARRHPLVLGGHRRGRRRVRARRDRPHPVPVAGRSVARGAARRAPRATALDAFGAVDLPAAALVLAQGAGRLIRTGDRSRRRRGARSAARDAGLPRAAPRRDAAVPAQRRPRRGVRVA